MGAEAQGAVVYASETADAARNSGGAVAAAKSLAKVLAERHPYYEANQAVWQKLIDFYEGRHLGRYIHRHQRESEESHAARVKRLVFRPFTKTIVELYGGFIFSRKIERAPVPASEYKEWRRTRALEKTDQAKKVKAFGRPIDKEWNEEFLNDCDRRGTKMDRFMAEAGAIANLLGYCPVVVDVPAVETNTEAEREEEGVRPYARRYTPLDLVNWELDDDGKFIWVRLREAVPGAIEPFKTRDEAIRDRFKDQLEGFDPGGGRRRKSDLLRKDCVRYRTYERNKWSVHDVYGEHAILVDDGTHELGEVPCVIVYSSRELRLLFGGQGVAHDVVGINQQILNLDNLIDEGIYQQTLSILVMGKQPIEGEEIVLSEQNVLEVSIGSFPPFFLSPPTAPLQFQEQRIQVLVSEIYRVSRMGPSMAATEAKVTPPGTASHEFNMTNRALAERADNFEQAEQQIHGLYYKWYDEEFRGWVNYPDDFAVRSIIEDLQTLQMAREQLRSPTAIRELEKQIIRKLLAHIDEVLVQRAEWETTVIPTIIKGFGPPQWIDELTQEIGQPGQPIGRMGHIIMAIMEKAGLNPDDFPDELPEGVADPSDPNLPPGVVVRPDEEEQPPVDPAAAAAGAPPKAEPKAETKEESEDEPQSSKRRRRLRKHLAALVKDT